MSRRVFTPKSRKEQLQQQLLMMIRVIRRRLDADVLDAAQKVAVEMQQAGGMKGRAGSMRASPRSEADNKPYKGDDGHVMLPYDRDNARDVVAHFLALKKNDPEISSRVLNALKQND